VLHKDGTLVANHVRDKVLIFMYNITMYLAGAINKFHC